MRVRAGGFPLKSTAGVVLAVVIANGYTSHRKPTVRLREGPRTVHLQLATDTGNTNKCADAVNVALRDPLGTRQVIDDKTSTPLQVRGTPICETKDPARVCLTARGNSLSLDAFGLAPKSRLTIADSEGGRSFGSSDANGRAGPMRETDFGSRISATFIGTSATHQRFVATIHWRVGHDRLPSRADDPTTQSCGDPQIAAMQSGTFGRGCVPSDAP
jgi:hypothetical protein